jgi:hypothetical protein
MEETPEECLDRILGRNETMDLDPELETAKKYIDGTWALQHPLCWYDEYQQKYHAFYNDRFYENKRKLKGYRNARRWRDYLRVYNKRYWPTALLAIEPLVPAKRWGALVREFWIDADEFWKDQDAWQKIAVAAKGRVGLMTRDERKQLANMPNKVTLYRGAQRSSVEGLSWTTSLKWGRHFAYKSYGHVWMGTANRSDVIAFFNKYGEEKEIVILPEHVRGRILVPDSSPEEG